MMVVALLCSRVGLLAFGAAAGAAVVVVDWWVVAVFDCIEAGCLCCIDLIVRAVFRSL